MRNKLVLIFLTILLFGCNSEEGIHDLEKRNENWCWFINEETGKGEWIPIGDKTTVSDGDYKLFFCNGEIRQKGKLRNEVIKLDFKNEDDNFLCFKVKDGDWNFEINYK